MKLLAIILTIGLVGCSSTRTGTYSRGAISYNELASYKVTSQNCANIDGHINFIEDQLKRKGLLYAAPESLNEDDRKYNATARIIVWSLRIGCNNPDRYMS